MTRVALIVGLIVVVGASGYFYMMSGRVSEPPKSVQFVPVQQGQFTAYLVGRGKLVAKKTEQLSSLIGGTVSDKGVPVGQFVRKGTPIAGLRLVEHELKKRQQDLEFALIDLELAEAQVLQSQELLRAKAISERELKDATIRKFKQDKLVQSLREEVGERVMRAGFDGLLVEKLFRNNERVSAGAVLATIVDTSSYAAEIAVPQRNMRGVHQNQTIQFVSELFVGTRHGIVQEISRSSLTKQQSQFGGMDTEPEFIVKGSFERAPFDRVLIGSQIEARFILQEKENALFVPIEVIVYQNDTSTVLLAAKGKAVRRVVKIGLINERLIEIEQGVSMGDTLLTGGTLDVDDGSSIKAPEKPATDDQTKPRNRPGLPSR